MPVSVLNLWCAEGVRAVKLAEVQRLRFVNPVIENEFRRALETLALSHDTQKKAVSLHFAGEGKRKVEVGYVIENPIWKTSYRLVLGQGRQAVPARLGGGREPDRRGLERRDDGAGQRPADLVQDGPVQPAVRRPADGRAGTVRLPAAADLRRGDGQATDGVAAAECAGGGRAAPPDVGGGGGAGGAGPGMPAAESRRRTSERRRLPVAARDRGAAQVRRETAATKLKDRHGPRRAACKASRPRRRSATSSST